MTFTVTDVGNVYADGDTSAAWATGPNVTAANGDLLVLAVDGFHAGGADAAFQGPYLTGVSWTAAGEYYDGAGYYMAVWTAKVTSSISGVGITVGLTSALGSYGSGIEMSAVKVTGADASSPVIATTSFTSTTNNYSPSVTTTNTSELLVAAAKPGVSGAFTSSDLTLAGQAATSDYTMRIGTRVQSSAASTSVNLDAAGSGAATWRGWILRIKAGGALNTKTMSASSATTTTLSKVKHSLLTQALTVASSVTASLGKAKRTALALTVSTAAALSLAKGKLKLQSLSVASAVTAVLGQTTTAYTYGWEDGGVSVANGSQPLADIYPGGYHLRYGRPVFGVIPQSEGSPETYGTISTTGPDAGTYCLKVTGSATFAKVESMFVTQGPLTVDEWIYLENALGNDVAFFSVSNDKGSTSRHQVFSAGPYIAAGIGGNFTDANNSGARTQDHSNLLFLYSMTHGDSWAIPASDGENGNDFDTGNAWAQGDHHATTSIPGGTPTEEWLKLKFTYDMSDLAGGSLALELFNLSGTKLATVTSDSSWPQFQYNSDPVGFALGAEASCQAYTVNQPVYSTLRIGNLHIYQDSSRKLKTLIASTASSLSLASSKAIGRILSVASSVSASVSRAWATKRSLTASSVTSATLTSGRAVLRTLTVAAGSTVTFAKRIGKSLSTTSSGSAVMARGMVLYRTLTATAGSTVSMIAALIGAAPRTFSQVFRRTPTQPTVTSRTPDESKVDRA